MFTLIAKAWSKLEQICYNTAVFSVINSHTVDQQIMNLQMNLQR